MNNRSIKLFIVEGESRDVKIFEGIQDIPFPWGKIRFITLPACENIYMLWKTLKNDNFETDLIEILRERIDLSEYHLDHVTAEEVDEIFLFFDYDAHANNLPRDIPTDKAITDMLNTFNNETENGKLYISYPMIEAVRDWVDNDCRTVTGCVCPVASFAKYKENTAKNIHNQNVGKYTHMQWKAVIKNYILRVSHLFDFTHVPDFNKYKTDVTPDKIYEREKIFISHDMVFVLSAVPEFLLDYFSKKFWNNYVKIKKLRPCTINYNICKTCK